MSLFIGRLTKQVTAKDLEDLFHKFGKIVRCETKTGRDLDYGFIEFEDKRDAEDALRELNGTLLLGGRIAVEWARGTADGVKSRMRDDRCFGCGETGHIVRDCPKKGGSFGRFGRNLGSTVGRERDSHRKSRSKSRSSSSSRSKSSSRSRSRSRSESTSKSRSPPRKSSHHHHHHHHHHSKSPPKK